LYRQRYFASFTRRASATNCPRASKRVAGTTGADTAESGKTCCAGLSIPFCEHF
jgi:hypothetical protein